MPDKPSPSELNEAEKLPPKQEALIQIWGTVALILGYNELAKEAKTLGDRVYFRLARDQAEAVYIAEGGNGGKPLIDRSEVTVLTLDVPAPMPRIEFREKDIELMRACVADHDATKGLKSDAG